MIDIHIPGYGIERELGRGGMATVYLAVQQSLDRPVALKVMKAALAADDEFAERFVREARTAARLQHPGIVSIFDAGVSGHHSYIAMEYIAGEDLKSRMRQGNLAPSDAVMITAQIARALAYAHEEGFVHRDVKPENILFRKDGGAVLSDFGIARAIGSGTRMTATGLSIGTPHYMSPEQARGKDVDGRSDLYALGVVFYEMLSGRVPFDAQDSFAVGLMHINEAPPALPAGSSQFQPVVDRLLAKDPAERYKSGDELVADLDRLEKGEAVEPAGRVTRKADHGRRADHGLMESGSHGSSGLTDKDGSTESRGHGSSGTGGSRSGLYWALGGGALAIVLAAGMYLWQEQSAPMSAGGGSATTARPAPSAADRGSPEARSRSPESGLSGVSQREEATLRVQQLLNRLGYTVLESGQLDARTEASIRAFEASQELVPSGAVDEILLQRLNGEYEQRELVRSIQRELRRLGREITPDGEYGPATASEVRAFERAVGREASGAASQDLLATLRSINEWPLEPGDVFRDCPDCPEMVVIPAGSFTMGSPSSEPQRDSDEGPQHRVTLKSFALGKTEVTFEQWQACVSVGDCSHRPSDSNWGRGNRPVINVSWNDAQEYVAWLSRKTGEDYRLPSEAEWEYAARADTTTRFNTGNCITTEQANFYGNRLVQGCPSGEYRTSEYRRRTLPVGSFASNAFGLHDMHGNVWEWVQDCWNDSYRGAPSDGSAWMRGDCGHAMLRGGSWSGDGTGARSASRTDWTRGTRGYTNGFRVARSIDFGLQIEEPTPSAGESIQTPSMMTSDAGVIGAEAIPGPDEELRQEYLGTIRELIKRNWRRPAGLVQNPDCTVVISQSERGHIKSVEVIAPCNLDGEGRQSLRDAVMGLESLPRRGYEAVFSETLLLQPFTDSGE